MTWFTGTVAFICIWWVALFAVLPWYIRRAPDEDLHSGPGAPENPRIKQKFIATTILSVVLWFGLYALVDAEVINFRDMAEKMAEQDRYM